MANKWIMRSLLVLSAASMALAVAPSASATGNGGSSPATSSSSDGYSRYSSSSYSSKYCQKSNSSSSQTGYNKNGKKKCKITICHRTKSQTNPYVKITVSKNSTSYWRHKRHDGDIIPAPKWGCPKPGYNPDDIDLRAQYKGDKWVKFSLKGCPKYKKVTVKIGDVEVAHSPFKVPKSGLLKRVVRIPSNAEGDVLQITCPKPYIVWEVVIGETPPVKHTYSRPSAPKPSSYSNPAYHSGGSSSSDPVPFRRVGFGFTSFCGLVMFGRMRRKPQFSEIA